MLFVAGTVPIPDGHFESRIISTQLITVHAKKQKQGYWTSCILIIQFVDSVWACFMDYKSDGGSYKDHKNKKLNNNPIAKVKQIRDHNQTIYFAEQDQSKFTIV